jgi:hypothetical protein
MLQQAAKPVSQQPVGYPVSVQRSLTFAVACMAVCLLQVWISAAEVAAMAQYLGITVPDFESHHCQPYSGVTGWRLLQSKLVDAPQQQQQLGSPSVQEQQQQQQVGA